MDLQAIMEQLQNMKVAVFSTVDEKGQPHGRFINIGVANEHGVFFMTSTSTDFYKQLQNNPNIAVTGYSEEDYLIQTIRIEGEAIAIGRDRLADILENNSYVDMVYPDKKAQEDLQVFHLHQGEGFYHSLTQGHRYTFEFGK